MGKVYKNKSIMKEIYSDAISYVRSNKTWEDWEEEEALCAIENRQALPYSIVEEIYELMCEYYEGDTSWYDDIDEQDIFLAL